jgi:predicted ferric reductase
VSHKLPGMTRVSKGIHPGALMAAYVLLGVLPLFFMAWQYDSDARVVREVAIAAGLLALALLLLQFVSSGRYETLSRRAGIDRTMRFHQLAARAVLVLAILHVLLFLVPSDAAGLREVPSRAARMFAAPRLTSGVVAWAVLLVLMVMGLWRNRLALPYELWRAMHMLAAVVAAAAGIHHALAIGGYSSDAWLAAYWWALGALAFGTLGYLYLVKPFLLLRTAHRVVSNQEVGHGIRELVLTPARGKPFVFEAGQFAWVLLDQPPVTLLDHPFSISSAPEALPEVRLLIKARGDFTSGLKALAPGARAYLDGPHGNFTLGGRSGKTITLIAGGIGIAPVMGILRHLRVRGDPRPIGVLYGARSPRQLVHAAEIRDARATLDLECRFFVDEPPPQWDGGVGELTKAALREAIRGEPGECLCFLCGPTPMMLACREHLLACGVPAGQIVFERFDYD